MRGTYMGSLLKDASFSNQLEGAELRYNITMIAARRHWTLPRSSDGKRGLHYDRRGRSVGCGWLTGLIAHALKCYGHTC